MGQNTLYKYKYIDKRAHPMNWCPLSNRFTNSYNGLDNRLARVIAACIYETLMRMNTHSEIKTSNPQPHF